LKDLWLKYGLIVPSFIEIKINDPIRNLVPKFEHVKATNKLWKLKVKTNIEGQNVESIYVTPFVAVCTGHHGTPRMAKFEGQETFPGEIIHSVKYKSAKMNNFEGKRVLLVGIGNSSVDVADNLVTEGK
jgi:cation diffusion facilitator CzcD-associated flavoprotein CzcO